MVQSTLLSKEKSIDHYFLNRYESRSDNFLKLIGKSISCGQMHQNKIGIVGKSIFHRNSDGLISSKKCILTIRTADCLPIFIYAPDKKVILALHAGWKSLFAGLITNAFQELSLYGVDSINVKVGIGPHIGVCCYQVDKSLIKKFMNIIAPDQPFFQEKENNYYLNLSLVAIFQLKNKGVLQHSIDDVNICTNCSDDYYSYRRDHTDQRNYNLLMIK